MIIIGIIVSFFSIFCTFLLLKYISTFLYKERYLKIIIIDTLVVSIYLTTLNIGIIEESTNPISGIGWALLFLVIIPYIYAFIKAKILRKYFNWEVGMYYPITEFLVVLLGYFGSFGLGILLAKLITSYV